MNRHDDEGNQPAAGSQPNAQPDPARPDPGDATGTWAHVSPFATSPESYGGTPAAPAQPASDASPGPADPQAWPPTQPGQGAPTWGAPAGPGPDGKPPSRWKTWQKVAAGGALVAVVGIGGMAAVTAASASSSDDSTTQSGPGGQGFGGGQGFLGGDASGGAGARGGGMAGAMELANALHGDFVVSSGSGTQTMRLQLGEITALSGSSLTVQSTDGYSSTWAIGSGVDVSGLSQGDTVRVLGTVSGDAATATTLTSGNASTAGGFGPGGMPGQGGRQAPEGMTPPNDNGQALQTS